MVIEITLRNWENYTIKYTDEAQIKRFYPIYCTMLKELKNRNVIFSYTITIKGDCHI